MELNSQRELFFFQLHFVELSDVFLPSCCLTRGLTNIFKQTWFVELLFYAPVRKVSCLFIWWN